MKYKTISLAVLLSLSVSAQADEWKFLPILDGGYKFNTAVAIVGGQHDFKDGENETTKGIEVSIDCPLLKPPHHTIRQQISYTETDEKGVETKSFELNPHHMFNMGNNIQVGVGPSLGFTNIDNGADDDTVFTYGLGASARYNISQKLFVGVEARHIWSEDAEISGIESDIENTRVLAKIGYQF
jgi:hypothetical protein